MSQNSEESENNSSETMQANGSNSGSLPPSVEQHQQIPLAKEKKAVRVRRAMGRGTPAGRRRSGRNAAKHDIFSNPVALKGESREDYESLREALRDYHQPVGEHEEVCVQLLAVHYWRYSRLVRAEIGEIRKRQELFEWDRSLQRALEAEQQVAKTAEDNNAPISAAFLQPDPKEGLFWRADNPVILARILELLAEFREQFKAEGFSSDGKERSLETIYGGQRREHLRDTLYDDYASWFGIAQVSKQERESDGYASPEQCRENVLNAIDAEILRLKRYEKALLKMEALRTEIEKLRQSVPDSPYLERLLRYQVTLDRSIDRTLSRLEGLQRKRLGQPVPPQLKVQVSET